MKTPNIKKLISHLIIVTIITTSTASLAACGNNLSASTMRLLKLEGTVKLYENDKERTITDNLRLNAGNILNTESKSLAGIALDDTKIVTIDELSRAQFDQNGKKLDINLTQGSLFFEVTKKLDSDESFDIRTSTMVVGIRGTSGYVAVDDEGHETLIITDGTVEVKGTNPVTGETKTVTVSAGQRIRVYLYNDRSVDSIMFELEDVTEDDLNLFVLECLREDFSLVELVCSETGWSIDKIMGADSTDTMLASNAASTEDQSSGEASDQTTGESNDVATGQSTNQASTGDSIADASTEASTEDTPKKSGVSKYIVSTDANGIMTLTTGQHFDAAYYAKQNPDVASEIGTDPDKLLEHFLAFGTTENRYGSAQDKEAAEAEEAQRYLEWQKALSEAQAAEAEAAKQKAQSQGGNSGGNSGGGVPTTEGGDGDGDDI